MRRNEQIDVERALALASVLNFLCSCARGCLLPFLTLYLRQLGLTPAMTGVVMGTKHLIALGWGPAASLLSKRYDKRRAVIIGSLMCSAAVALVLLLIPPAGVHMQGGACNASNLSSGAAHSVGDKLHTSSVRLEKSTGPAGLVSQPVVTFPAKTSTDAKSAPVMMTSTTSHDHRAGGESHPQLSRATVAVAVNNSPRDPRISSATVHPVTSSSAAAVRAKSSNSKSASEELQGEKTSEKEEERHFDFLESLLAMDPQYQLFFMVLIVVSAWECASAPQECTADDGLYEYLDFADASDRYSSKGLWDLLGAACGAAGAGLLVSQLSCLVAGQTRRSVVHFYCYAALAVLALPAACYLPLYRTRERQRNNGLLRAGQLVPALLCGVTTLLVGAACSAVENFLLWQMQDHGSNELHMGLSLALALLSQATFPLLAGHVSKILSPGRVLAVGAASLGLQCCYFSFLWGPWAALPAQTLSCLSSGALWWAVSAQCEDVAMPGAERRVRRLYGALSLHLGRGLGSFAGGAAVQRFGLTWMFRGVAVGLMAWCACLPLLLRKAPRQRRINYSRLLAATASEASDSESEQERAWLDKTVEDDRSNNNYGRRINH